MKNGVKAGIHAKYVPICVVKPIGVDSKVNKGAKNSNRYNQISHLSKDTKGKVPNSQSECPYDSELGQRSTGCKITIKIRLNTPFCHLLSIKPPLNSLKLFRMKWRFILYLIHNLGKS